MRIIAQCPKCGSNWLLDGSKADRRLTCRRCGRLFKVPKPQELPRAVKVIEQARRTVYVDQDGNTYG